MICNMGVRRYYSPRLVRSTGTYIGKNSIVMMSNDQPTDNMLTSRPNLPKSKFGCGGKTLRPRTSRMMIGITYPIWIQTPPQLTMAWKKRNHFRGRSGRGSNQEQALLLECGLEFQTLCWPSRTIQKTGKRNLEPHSTRDVMLRIGTDYDKVLREKLASGVVWLGR